MATADYVTVARVEDVPAGTAKAVEVEGQPVAIANVDGRFHAVQGDCLHLQGPLGEGPLEGFVLTCPWHGWQYDVRTGENEFDRAICLRTYQVQVENGEVRVAV